MPIYEYHCQKCLKEFQALVMRAQEIDTLSCPICGAGDIRRLLSRVAYHASERDRLAAYDPRASRDDSFYKDSRNIGLHAQKRAQEMGVDLGSGFEAKLEKLRTNPGSVLDSTD